MTQSTKTKSTLTHVIHRQGRIIIVLLIGVPLLINCGGRSKPGNENGDVPPTAQIQIKQSKPLSDSDIPIYISALDLIHNENYRDAEKSLAKLAKRNSASLEVWANLAIAQYKQKRLEQANKSAQQAAALGPEDAQVHNLLGLLAVENGKFVEAEIHYKKSLALNKEFAFAHYNIALLYDIYFQDIANAYAHYNRYLALINNADKETVDWIEQLKYSLHRDTK